MMTREGWYYLGMLGFIIAGAAIRDINLLYIMAGMMLGPLLFSFMASTKSLRRLNISRRFQTLVGVGDPLYVEIDAKKPKGSSHAFSTVVRDRIFREGGSRRSVADASLFFSHIPGGGGASGSYRAQLQRRGRYRLGPMLVSTSMPLGLIRATTTLGRNQEVLVSPQLGTLLLAWSRRLELKSNGGQKSSRRRGQSEGDFYGMREWRNGDSRNWIHWRTSAKRNKLTVRQFEQRMNQDLVIILDLWQPQRSKTPNREIELAISFAATLVVDQTSKGSSHLLVASASESGFVLQGTSSPVLRQELMERFATLEPSTSDTLPEVIAAALPKAAANSKVILVSPHDRDLRDTELFESIWKRTDIRRSIIDIVKVNTASAEFAELFHLDESGQKSSVSGRVSVSDRQSEQAVL